MTKIEFYILNSLYNGSLGRSLCRSDIENSKALANKKVYQQLIDDDFINKETNQLTSKALLQLESYRVNNAVILAAGPSPHFIPLSLEKPKGLFEVKGERLIERQIKQLQEAGISDITIVLGYKKEQFYYLKNKYQVKFIENSAFGIKSNIESLLLCEHILNNTYICVCDNYFIENPFNQFEYQTFNSGISFNKEKDEMYVDTDEDGRIICMQPKRKAGMVLMGQAYWQKDFCDSFIKLAKADLEVGKYDHAFWEWMVKDYLNEMPPIYFKEYANNNNHEFDYFEDLRQFDETYLINGHSEILRNIKLVFRCDEEDIVNFRNISKGLTNKSFIFQIDNQDYIYRHPGEGTDSIIERRNEKKSLIKAKEIGIDPTYIYEDSNDGWKISSFVKEFREPDYRNFEDSKRIINVLRKLHQCDYKANYGMQPWEDALDMEELLKRKNPHCFVEHEQLKAKIGKIYQKTLNDGVQKCFCHGDTYQPNWMIKPDGEVILIDWEYAGYADPGIDVGYYIVDAMYDFAQADRFISEYLQEQDEQKHFHFMAYVAIIAYYWFVWALYRQSCGADMGESLDNWHNTALKYADYVLGLK